MRDPSTHTRIDDHGASEQYETDHIGDVWERLEDHIRSLPPIDPDEPHYLFNPLPPGTPCPDGPHRGPQGPNEDLGCCLKCGNPSWCMRPEGEEFGGHAPDCSLPRRHESYCKPGGNGHPAPEVMRG